MMNHAATHQKRYALNEAMQSQRGINMVDLMMWLVIAALLLAAALQSIGFYQQRAYIEQMSNDADNAGKLAVAMMSESGGSMDFPLLQSAVEKTKTTGDVYLISKNLGMGDFAVEATHPHVSTHKVMYLFDQRDNLKPGINLSKLNSANSTVDAQSFTSVAAACATGSWAAQYYTNVNHTGSPALTKCEATNGIYYSWGLGAPAVPGIDPEQFSTTWTKNINVPVTKEYDFSIIGDDGLWVYVDGKQIIESTIWYGTQKPTQTARVRLTAGDHNIVVKHNERGGGASINFNFAPVP